MQWNLLHTFPEIGRGRYDLMPGRPEPEWLRREAEYRAILEAAPAEHAPSRERRGLAARLRLARERS